MFIQVYPGLSSFIKFYQYLSRFIHVFPLRSFLRVNLHLAITLFIYLMSTIIHCRGWIQLLCNQCPSLFIHSTVDALTPPRLLALVVARNTSESRNTHLTIAEDAAPSKRPAGAQCERTVACVCICRQQVA